MRLSARCMTLGCAALLAGCGGHYVPPPPAADAGWAHYGGDAGGTRYSPASQITPANVKHL
jgi:quinoprotein glucose dehydrogenase